MTAVALFHVRMDVDIPRDLDPDVRAETLAREKKYSQDLQHSGKWVHIWRITGKFSNISIFDVETPDELHETPVESAAVPVHDHRRHAAEQTRVVDQVGPPAHPQTHPYSRKTQ